MKTKRKIYEVDQSRFAAQEAERDSMPDVSGLIQLYENLLDQKKRLERRAAASKVGRKTGKRIRKHPDADKSPKSFDSATRHLTIEEFIREVESLSDISLLKQADDFARRLRQSVQARIKEVLGIDTQATVCFNLIETAYHTKEGRENRYHTLKVSWNEAGKTKSKTLKL
jgi:hypothetical protein